MKRSRTDSTTGAHLWFEQMGWERKLMIRDLAEGLAVAALFVSLSLLGFVLAGQ